MSAAVLVEVTPLSISPLTAAGDKSKCLTSSQSPIFSAPVVKLRLRQWSLSSFLGTSDPKSGLGIHCQESSADAETQRDLRRGNLYSDDDGDSSTTEWVFLLRNHRTVPLLFIESEDPVQPTAFPCWVVGYFRSPRTCQALVSEGTLVRILPVEEGVNIGSLASLPECRFCASSVPARSLTDVLSGELNVAQTFDKALDEEVLRNHDVETVESLKLRMALLLSQPVMIGTTADALVRHHQQNQKSLQMQQFLKNYTQTPRDSQQEIAKTQATRMQSSASTIPSLLWESSLTVHDASHGSGKTLLVQAIARRLKCKCIHVIRSGPLMAKYGIHADAGLESLLHGITTSAAARDGKDASICIILDHLDAFLPPSLSGGSGAGDAAAPVLNAIASYLKGLSHSLNRKREFPFPTKCPLYNLRGVKGDALSIRICIVGIVTCPDDGGRSVRRNSSGTSRRGDTVLDALAGGQFRVPNLSSKTRLLAFQQAFADESVELSAEAIERLPVISASAVSARGIVFQNAARKLKQIIEVKKIGPSRPAMSKDLEIAITAAQKRLLPSSISQEISFPSGTPGGSKAGPSTEDTDLFGMVGGNTEAKRALEDALALDPLRRRHMSNLGFSAPTGVLLYGPPGNGKTKLAKAVAELLKSQGGSTLGGAFISLRASDIVLAEVGTGEKALVRAFQAARANSPSVIFIDEFQALFSQRSRGGSGRLTSTLLQCMDDVSSWRDADERVAGDDIDEIRVVVIGATNTPWLVDSAFLRPGRFENVVHVGLPNLLERISILFIYVQNMKLRHGESRAQIESLCRNIAEKCHHYSGADLVALCRAAAIRCLAEQGEGGKVEETHFLDALKYDVRYSSSLELVQRLSKWHP